MEVKGGDILIVKTDAGVKRWRISKIDGNVVKIFEEDGSYKQMPYNYLKELYEEGFVEIEALPFDW